MLLSLLPLVSAVSALSITQNTPPQHIVAKPPVEDVAYDIPTIHESAVMARRILKLTTIGNLVSTFPTLSNTADDDLSASENRPAEVQGSPISLMEYIADCEDTGNPTVLAINIATPFRNYHAGSNVSLSVRWWPNRSNFYTFDAAAANTPDIPTPHTPAALPRFSLHGYLERIAPADLFRHYVPACFLKEHPDSMLWQPGNDISHESEYMRFVVEQVYWFGGFGDRARIGWLPIEEWRGVTTKEIEECRLPGEKKREEMDAGGSEDGAKVSWWREWL